MTFLCQIYRTKRRRDLPVILNIIYARTYKDSGCLRAELSLSLSLPLRTTASVFSIQVRRVVHGARDKPCATTTSIWTQRTANRKTISIHCFARPINIVNIGLLNYRSQSRSQISNRPAPLNRKLASFSLASPSRYGGFLARVRYKGKNSFNVQPDVKEKGKKSSRFINDRKINNG